MAKLRVFYGTPGAGVVVLVAAAEVVVSGAVVDDELCGGAVVVGAEAEVVVATGSGAVVDVEFCGAGVVVAGGGVTTCACCTTAVAACTPRFWSSALTSDRVSDATMERALAVSAAGTRIEKATTQLSESRRRVLPAAVIFSISTRKGCTRTASDETAAATDSLKLSCRTSPNLNSWAL